ncbi:AAA family ATPase [Thaumasiovibrio sp. DFM-14]|uniref:ATP-binding protein n=1 Tax=Thaumasiovibrio sp. DFM-14 TaxID=3384792 RepID=UPI0039A27FC9
MSQADDIILPPSDNGQTPQQWRKPTQLSELDVPERLLEALLLKHLQQSIEANVIQLSDKLAIPGNLIEQIVRKLKTDALLEVKSQFGATSLTYTLTQKGRQIAQLELQRDGYLGPAPISLSLYRQLITHQAQLKEELSPDTFSAALSDVILSADTVNLLGPALNSGRAIFIYGLPGTGKTYISKRLIRLYNTPVYIPYAIYVNNQIIQVFDPILHHPVEQQHNRLLLSDGNDTRLILCERPEVVVGGELTSDMLEISVDQIRNINLAPLQMKANNGILIIDDLGRQRVSVDSILNRWIVPLEEKIDYLTLSSGEHFKIPFEQVLVFSSNIHPKKLADDAFLRRIGYKIEFKPVSSNDYKQLWRAGCESHGLSIGPESIDYITHTLHRRFDIPLLPCYPRDLSLMCKNQIDFHRHPPTVTTALIDSAWQSYFVDEINEHHKE